MKHLLIFALVIIGIGIYSNFLWKFLHKHPPFSGDMDTAEYVVTVFVAVCASVLVGLLIGVIWTVTP